MKQAEAVYKRLIAFEEQAATIYLQMASHFTPENMELGAFWLEMGIQEKQHAGLLQFCVAERLFADDLPEESRIQELQDRLVQLGKRASDSGLTTEEAFAIAVELETCEINAIYDLLTTPAHASMYLLRRKIATTLPHHFGELLQQARKFKVREEILSELERQIARHAGEQARQENA